MYMHMYVYVYSICIYTCIRICICVCTFTYWPFSVWGSGIWVHGHLRNSSSKMAAKHIARSGQDVRSEPFSGINFLEQGGGIRSSNRVDLAKVEPVEQITFCALQVVDAFTHASISISFRVAAFTSASKSVSQCTGPQPQHCCSHHLPEAAGT